jgi:DNA repair protein RecO (recombination protein O)
MNTYQTEALIIRNQDFGETDVLLTLLTCGAGKIRAILKSGRKSTSKMAGICQSLNRINLTYYAKEHAELGKVIRVEMLKSHDALRADLVKLAWSSFYFEVLLHSTADHEVNEELFETAGFYLEELEKSSPAEIRDLNLFHLVRLMQINGFPPLMSQCVRCGKPRPVHRVREQAVFYLDSRWGGILCSPCRKKAAIEKDIHEFTPDSLIFLEKAMSEAGSVREREPSHADIFQPLFEYLVEHARHQLETDFKSLSFLQAFIG